MTEWQGRPILRVVWARAGESAAQTAQMIDAFLAPLSQATGVDEWELTGGRVWPVDAEAQAEAVASRVDSGATGTAQSGDGFNVGLSGESDTIHLHLVVNAGADHIGRRVPAQDALLRIFADSATAWTPETADAAVTAAVEAFRPLMVLFTTQELNSLARRGNWLIPPGYRLWLADSVGAVSDLPDGVTATGVGEGTLLTVPDSWESQRVLDAMAAVRERNGLDGLRPGAV